MTNGLILNTRASFYQERFHDVFGDLPWAIFDCPVSQAEPAGDMNVPMANAFDALIFTSQVGVATFAPTREWLGKKVYAVGEGTAQAAVAAGFTDVLQTGLNVDDMRRYLSTTDFGTALYPSADEVTADLSKEFPGRIRREVIYRMAPRADLPIQIVTPALTGTLIVVPLFSRRAADTLAGIMSKAGITANNAKVTAVGISANVFAPDSGPWKQTAVADQPTLESLVAKTGEVIESLST